MDALDRTAGHRTRGLGVVYDVRAMAGAGSCVALATETVLPAVLTWDLVRGRSSRVRLKTRETWALALARDGRRAYVSDLDAVCVIDTTPSPWGPLVTFFRRQSAPVLDHGGKITALALSPDGTTLVSSGWGGMTRAWAISSWTQRWARPSVEGAIAAGVEGPLLCAHREHLEAVDWETGETRWRRPFPGLERFVVSGDGKVVAAPDRQERAVRVQLLEHGETLPPIAMWNDETVAAVALDATAARLAVGHGDGRVSVYELPSQRVILRAATDCESLHQLAFVGDRWVAGGGRDTSLGAPLHLWEVPAG